MFIHSIVYDAWDFCNLASSKFEFVDLYSYLSTQKKFLQTFFQILES